jgi:D-alanyl-D-alanine endopeptidase (penicillin-binding protein 7)
MRETAIAALAMLLLWVAPAGAGQDRSPRLASSSVIVVDQQEGTALFAKNTDTVTPIASITKLMTAMVVLDARLPLEEPLFVDHEDMDFVKGTRSRLQVGTTLTRGEMLKLALMASENRAASALGRNYPGGIGAFVEAMNRKARDLGMRDTRFVDSTGLNPGNVSTAQDLVRLVEAGMRYPLIRSFSTSTSHVVEVDSGDSRSRLVAFNNSNGLVRRGDWDIGLSKTGYIAEAGRCLVMQARIAARPVIIVLLDSWGKLSRVADANRIKQWIELEITGASSTRVADARPARVQRTVKTRATASRSSRARI